MSFYFAPTCFNPRGSSSGGSMPGTGIEPPEDDPRGLKHVGAKIQDKITDCNIL
jgi:hypothetical protein